MDLMAKVQSTKLGLPKLRKPMQDINEVSFDLTSGLGPQL